MFEIADNVLISVPYLWPEDADEDHVNDPVDEEKLKQWTGREPSYSIIVTEPLRIPAKGISRRLISYYGPEGKQINYQKARENVTYLQKLDDQIETEEVLKKLFYQLGQNSQTHIEIQNDFKKAFKNIKRNYDLKMDILNLENDLKNNVSVAKEMKNKSEALQKKISHYDSHIKKLEKEQQYYVKEYNKIIQSNSWKLMTPMRKMSSVIKSLTRKNA